MSHSIVFIGAGNLATRLAVELKKKGYSVTQVYSRSEKSASLLAQKLETQFTTKPNEIFPDADVYFVALKDSAFEEVLPMVTFNNKLVVHCSGSMALSSLEKYSENIGVFYPLQTFSKNREVNFSEIPVFIEANAPENEKKLLEMAGRIAQQATVMDSAKRLFLHVSAVFACNFVNYFYAIASEVLHSKDIPFDVLHPLILETAMKVQKMEPLLAQTGPAVRCDENIISTHLDTLKAFPDFRNIYKFISESIFKFYQNR